ncbi:MAG: putative ABC transporter permease [Mycoplasmatales bacterium]
MTFIILLFMIYAFMGYFVEVSYVFIRTHKIHNRGFLHLPIIPIYAFGALIILYSLESFKTNPILIFSLGLVLTTSLEYLTSFIMEKLFNMRWWDYSDQKYNINGRVCLLNSILFGILCLVVTYLINPVVVNIINSIDLKVQKDIADIFIVLLIIDMSYTLRDLISIPVRDIKIQSGVISKYANGKLKSLEELSKDLKDHHFGDGYLIKEFMKGNPNKKFNIHIPLIILIVGVIIVGIAIHSLLALLVLSLFTIIISYIIYTKIKNY